MISIARLGTVAGMLCIPAAAQQTAVFSGAQNALSLTSAFDVSFADLDGDGHQDLLTCGGNQVVWLPGGADGFGAPVTIATSASSGGLSSVITADVDGDGDEDVIWCADAAASAGWVENVGGVFVPQPPMTTAVAGARMIRAFDVEGDGDLDFLVARASGQNQVTLITQDGATGTFSDSSFASGYAARSIDFADINEDGTTDVLVSDSNGGDVIVYPGLGGGAFAPGVAIPGGQSGIRDVELGDFNGDGHLDIASSRSANGSAGNPGSVEVVLSNGPGSFTAGWVTVDTDASLIRCLDSGDLNRDGALDLVATSASGRWVAWYAGDGFGGFGTRQVLDTTADGAYFVKLGDLDGDTDLDLAYASATAGEVRTQTVRVDFHLTPADSIQVALDHAVDGDRVLLAAGVYNQTADVSDKQFELRGEGASSTVLDGSGYDDTILDVQGAQAGSVVSGLSFTEGIGVPVPSTYVWDHYGAAMRIGTESQLLIEACSFYDNGWGDGTSAGSCTFGGAFFASGAGTTVTARGCVMTGNRAWASGGATMSAHSSVVVLDHCTVVDNVSTDFLGNQGGHALHIGGHVEVRNSIFWGNTGSQIACFQGYCSGTTSDVQYSNVQGGFAGAGNLGLDPLFLDRTGRDFTLGPGSPSIDASDPASTPDCDGTVADQGAVAPGCESFGATYCASNPNSTGSATSIVAFGDQGAAFNRLFLTVSGLPSFEYGYFVMSQSQGNTALPAPSQGILCLGAPMIRFNQPANGGAVLNSGADGAVSFRPDFDLLPMGAVFTPGSTWNFQYWHRDFDTTMGVQTSNTSNGLAITFD